MLSPRARCDAIVAEVTRDCESARAVFKDGEPHQWLQIAYMARLNRTATLFPTDVLRAMAADETRILSTLPWPDCAVALGMLFFMKEHPGVGGSDRFIASERSAYERLREMHRRDPAFSASMYRQFNPKLASAGEALANAPKVDQPALDLCAKAERWADGEITDDVLYNAIEYFRVQRAVASPDFIFK